MKTYGFEIEFTGESYEISQGDGTEKITIVISPEEASLLMDYIDLQITKHNANVLRESNGE